MGSAHPHSIQPQRESRRACSKVSFLSVDSLELLRVFVYLTLSHDPKHSIERLLLNSSSMRQAKEEVRASVLRAFEEHRKRSSSSSKATASSTVASSSASKHAADAALKSPSSSSEALISDDALEGRILHRLSEIGADKVRFTPKGIEESGSNGFYSREI